MNEKGWPECNVIEEEGSYDELDGDGKLSTRCRVFLIFIAFILFFACLCLILWGAARPYKADVVVKVCFFGSLFFYQFQIQSNDNSDCMYCTCLVNYFVFSCFFSLFVHLKKPFM